MAVYKCKMCGGTLELIQGESVAVCEYCDTKQTVPVADDEKKMNLFSRANRLRFACDFDKAAGVYESIITDFPEEAEAYWGLILCKYGIEYVDDPLTAKKIPTCHRSSFESVMDDENFELVMENADSVSRSVYREEAKQIEELRKGIIEVSAKEEPYDIFICYKETDENGDRTIDSVIAQDVYNELTEKGYRVFFSRITLEDKLGQEYEPYIFAALNSAKVMLAFGTDYEYYNAVWVKNEWSRFLQLIAKGEKKTLIPCYKNIDAYDMPKEFARLQAQDMGKVGAVQDLLRGIEKIIPKKEPVQVKETVVVNQSGGPNVEALLKRAFMFLEDGDFASADEYCEKVLDIAPECAEAYLGKLMVELKVKKQDDLKNQEQSFEQNGNYLKTIRFADDNLAETLKKYISYIKYERPEIEHKDSIYSKALELMQSKNESNIDQAKEMFDSIKDWRDSAEWIARSEDLKKDVIYNKAVSLAQSNNQKDIDSAVDLFESIKDWRDSVAWIARSENLKKDVIYNKAVSLIDSNKLHVVKTAQTLLKKIPGYKDVDNQIILAEENEKKIVYKNALRCAENDTITTLSTAISSLSTIEDWQDSKEKISEFKNRIEELELKDKKSKNRQQGLCQHCGGTFKGLFTKKCTNCGKEKDY